MTQGDPVQKNKQNKTKAKREKLLEFENTTVTLKLVLIQPEDTRAERQTSERERDGGGLKLSPSPTLVWLQCVASGDICCLPSTISPRLVSHPFLDVTVGHGVQPARAHSGRHVTSGNLLNFPVSSPVKRGSLRSEV